jgi:MFS family permease
MRNPCIKELAYTVILILISMSWGLTMGYWSSAETSFELDFDVGSNSTLSSREQLGTVFNLLAPAACIVGGPLINLLIRVTGRKIPTIATAAFTSLSWLSLGLTSLTAHEFWLACLFRSFLGLSVGATSALVPMYIDELTPDAFRSAFGTLHQFAIALGGSLSYLLGVLNFRWNTIAYFSAIPTALHLLLIWVVPESPAVYRQEILKTSELLCQVQFLRPMLVSVGLMFFQQFGGTTVFLANMQNIMADSGSSLAPSVASLLVGFAGAVASFCGSPLMNLLGPVAMWNISSGAQAVALALAALQERWQWNGLIPMICLFVDSFAFSVGTAPIPWFLVPELFPDGVRPRAVAVVTACCWSMATLLFFVWPAMKEGIGQAGGFGVFAGIMGLSLVFGVVALGKEKEKDDAAALTTDASLGLMYGSEETAHIQ